MTHQQIIDKDIVEQYALGKLTVDDRRAFQEHFFECDECFAQAQSMSDNIARVRYAAAAGALEADKRRASAASFWGAGWWRPVLACSMVASLLLAVALAWVWFSRAELQKQLAAERQARQTSAAGAEDSIEQVRRQDEEKQRELEAAQAELQRRLDELEKNKPAPRPDENLLAQANIPSVTLESSRDAGSAAQVTIPAEAKSILLQIPVEPGNRFQSFTLEVMTRNKAPIESVNGARPNRSGSLVVRVSATRLEAGDYRVRLYGVNQTQREFLAEYDLRVMRK